ncbi:protein kinase domain-containing protein [Stenotrophomonas lacuserhaii]|uniref:serine/threonine-protein kinase n=1 Tax=Stenotrophomonas lacuserhaii TaxID=2760084 RepID=UPI0032EFAAD6
MDALRWRELSSWLDQLLELDEDGRLQRLRQVAGRDPGLAAELEKMLAHERDSEQFMAQPVFSAPGSSRGGTRIGPYRLLQLLGEGGMGEVWLAERCDGMYERKVALKLLRSGLAEPGLHARFARERQILARLQHPHLAQLHNAGIDPQGHPYFALDYVQGEPITEYCQRRMLPLEERLRLMLQVCSVVAHAHANLVVHRDLKPSNILVADGGVKLLDFGIAQLLDPEGVAAVAAPGEPRAFTLHYAAPEQVRGDPLSTRTDVYSLGVVIYEVVTGHKPYRLRRHSDSEWERSILEVQPLPASRRLLQGEAGMSVPAAARRLARRVRGDLDLLLGKAMAKDPQQRYGSVDALAEDLRRFLDGRPLRAHPPGTGYRLRKYLRRHRWGVTGASLALSALLAVSTMAVWQARQARQETARAQAMQDFNIGLFDRAASVRHGHFDVRQLLETGQQRAQAELAGQPLALAEMEGVIGRLHIGLGDYQTALRILDQQRTLLQAQQDVPGALQLEAVTQRARALRMLGRDRECVTHLQAAASIADQQQDLLPTAVAGFASELAHCQTQLGQVRAARAAFIRALALYQRGEGNPRGIAGALAGLAGLDAEAGLDARAREGYQQALALLQRAAPGTPEAIGMRRQLGQMLARSGKAAEASAALDQAWQSAVQAFGPDHPETLVVQRSRALLALQQGRRAWAGPVLGEVRDKLAFALGPDHREVGLAEHALGDVAKADGNDLATVSHYRNAVRIWRQPDHVALLPQGLLDLGEAERAAGSPARAAAAWREARQLLIAQRGIPSSAVRQLDLRLARLPRPAEQMSPATANN